MRIIVKGKADQNERDLCAVIVALFMKKSKDSIIRLFIIGVLLVIVGLIDYNGFFQVTTVDGITGYNLHILLALGIVYTLFAVDVLWKTVRTKRKYLKEAEDRAVEEAAGTNELLIELDEEYVKYGTYMTSWKARWPIFTSYGVFRNYLLLYSGDHPRVGIDTRSMKEHEFEELMVFVKKRMPAKFQ